MEMRPVDVLTNLKGYAGYGYSSYGLNAAEAKVCIEAIEKQIPMDPVRYGYSEEVSCGRCTGIINGMEKRTHYCPQCGQAVRWQKGEGNGV